MWRIGWFAGKWMIKVVGHTVDTDEAEIPEWRPVAEAAADCGLVPQSYAISPAIRSMQSSPSSTACCISIIASAVQARVVRSRCALLRGQP